MTDDVRRLTTNEQRALLDLAKKKGGFCGVCGRAFADGDVVWIERFIVGTKLFGNPDLLSTRVYGEAPVGGECASPSFVARKVQEEPEPCRGCGRGVYVDAARENRGPICCSARCRSRVLRRKAL